MEHVDAIAKASSILEERLTRARQLKLTGYVEVRVPMTDGGLQVDRATATIHEKKIV